MRSVYGFSGNPPRSAVRSPDLIVLLRWCCDLAIFVAPTYSVLG